MKHVREDLPDVQMLRPEVSAGLAAILDRMTDKHLEHRYQDAHTLEADLEDALAVEAARSGRSTGEATAVIATLPEGTKRRLPLRMRRRFPVFAVIGVLVLGAAAVALLAVQGVDRTERGTGHGQGQGAPGHAGRVRQAHVGAGLRPARRPRRARRPGLPRRRQGPRHLLDDRELPRCHAGRQEGRRPLRRRRAQRRRHLDRDRHAEARVAGGDPGRSRRRRPARRPGPAQRLAARRRRQGQAQAPALQAAHRRQGATATTSSGSRSCPRAPSGSRSPTSRCSAAPPRRRGRARRGSARARSPAGGRRPRRTARPSPPTSSGSRWWRSCRAAC